MPARVALLAGTLVFALMLLIAAAAAGVVSLVTGGLIDPGGSGGVNQFGSGDPQVACQIGGGIHGAGLDLSAAQAGNAAVINQVALDDGLRPSDRAAVIALATAMQESGLLNLDYGDRDSLGLFQQRPSQGWGSPAQIMNPAYAADRFFAHLQRIPNWWSIPLWQAAQGVQSSAYPTAYQQWQPRAEILERFLAADPNSCSLRAAG